MPSPKSVIRDIHDLKLDPKKAHTSTDKSGRLVTKDIKTHLEQKQDVKNLKSALVAIKVDKEETLEDQTETENTTTDTTLENNQITNNLSLDEQKFEKRSLKKRR